MRIDLTLPDLNPIIPPLGASDDEMKNWEDFVIAKSLEWIENYLSNSLSISSSSNDEITGCTITQITYDELDQDILDKFIESCKRQSKISSATLSDLQIGIIYPTSHIRKYKWSFSMTWKYTIPKLTIYDLNEKFWNNPRDVGKKVSKRMKECDLETYEDPKYFKSNPDNQ